MVNPLIIAYLLVLPYIVSAASALTSATSTATCNPLKTSSCPPDKALATSFSESFTSESKWFYASSHSERIKYNSDGLEITLAQRFDNPAIKSNFYIMFGRLEVVLKAAPGRGVVSSFYLQSDDLDEIDLEWIGSDITEVQTNYFSKGNTTTYDRGQFHGVHAPQNEFHNYTIDWTKEALTWYLDGKVLRTLTSDSPAGYPQTPMYVMSGVWAGGDPDNAAGTIEWAGGLTDYSQAPFSMYIKKVVVADYSTGTEYSYNDQSGDWTSIKATNGVVNGRIQQAAQEFDTLVNGASVSNYAVSSDSSEQSSSTSGFSSSSIESVTSSTISITTSENNSVTSSSTSESLSPTGKTKGSISSVQNNISRSVTANHSSSSSSSSSLEAETTTILSSSSLSSKSLSRDSSSPTTTILSSSSLSSKSLSQDSLSPTTLSSSTSSSSSSTSTNNGSLDQSSSGANSVVYRSDFYKSRFGTIVCSLLITMIFLIII